MLKPLDGISEAIAWVAAPSYWCFGSLCSAWNEEWSRRMPMDDMFATRHYWVSLLLIAVFTMCFFTICGVKLQGIKVAELSRTAELESWLKKRLVSDIQD
jgi:hypothetical protein